MSTIPRHEPVAGAQGPDGITHLGIGLPVTEGSNIRLDVPTLTNAALTEGQAATVVCDPGFTATFHFSSVDRDEMDPSMTRGGSLGLHDTESFRGCNLNKGSILVVVPTQGNARSIDLRSTGQTIPTVIADGPCGASDPKATELAAADLTGDGIADAVVVACFGDETHTQAFVRNSSGRWRSLRVD